LVQNQGSVDFKDKGVLVLKVKGWPYKEAIGAFFRKLRGDQRKRENKEIYRFKKRRS
jgi:hypothetical protein